MKKITVACLFYLLPHAALQAQNPCCRMSQALFETSNAPTGKATNALLALNEATGEMTLRATAPDGIGFDQSNTLVKERIEVEWPASEWALRQNLTSETVFSAGGYLTIGDTRYPVSIQLTPYPAGTDQGGPMAASLLIWTAPGTLPTSDGTGSLSILVRGGYINTGLH